MELHSTLNERFKEVYALVDECKDIQPRPKEGVVPLDELLEALNLSSKKIRQLAAENTTPAIVRRALEKALNGALLAFPTEDQRKEAHRQINILLSNLKHIKG